MCFLNWRGSNLMFLEFFLLWKLDLVCYAYDRIGDFECGIGFYDLLMLMETFRLVAFLLDIKLIQSKFYSCGVVLQSTGLLIC